MNWTLAVPELVLACCGMAILIYGVLMRRDTFLSCSMLTVGAFVLAALPLPLVLSRKPLRTSRISPPRKSSET
jgi:NADH:ubiquinone oxidoreductase subunit 2 (subunit N)